VTLAGIRALPDGGVKISFLFSAPAGGNTRIFLFAGEISRSGLRPRIASKKMTADEMAVFMYTCRRRRRISCFRLAQTDAGCANCYRRCLDSGAGAAKWNWICPHGLEHIILRTAFSGREGGGRTFAALDREYQHRASANTADGLRMTGTFTIPGAQNGDCQRLEIIQAIRR
jgi:hypothetical protein